nr:ribonuclease H-like domain-containing protein [Tanacetum cinerariifolium]
MKSNLKQTEFYFGVTKGLNQKKICDNENPKRPNVEGRVSSNDDCTELSLDIQGNGDSEAISMDEKNNTHLVGIVPNETDFVNDFYENSEFNSDVEELPVNTVRSIEPTCYEEAILDNNWIDAMNAEIEALNKNYTWKLLNYLLIGKLLPLFQLDVNNAFLYGDLDEEIYITIPEGFANKDNKNKEIDFVQSVNDHSLFRKSKNNKFIALLVYVDDIVVTDNCVDEIDKFKNFLKSKKYCLELLKEYGLLGCKPIFTPMKPNSVLSYIANKDDPLLDNITAYQKLLGKLIYLTYIRPNIAYYVHCLALYMHSPFKSYLNCALNVLKYVKNAPGNGIRYNHLDCENNLKGYGDAD